MPAVGIFELRVIFASCVAPNAAYTVEPGSISIAKTIVSSAGTVGGVGAGVVPPPDFEQDIVRHTNAAQTNI